MVEDPWIALAAFSRRLAGEASGGVLGDALDAIAGSTALAAGFAFAGDALDPVAERGQASGPESRERARALAARAVRARARVEAEPEALAAGWPAASAIPLLHRRTVVGVLVVVPVDAAELGGAARRFCDIVAAMAAMAVDREQLVEAQRGVRYEAEEADRVASLGLLTASVAHELRGPVEAIALHGAEQERLLKDLDALGRSDAAVASVARELGEVARDLTMAAARIRETTMGLATADRAQKDPESIDLASVVRDATWIARPRLERRGITLIEQVAPSCFTIGRRDSLTLVVQNLVWNAADACERSGPRGEVRVSVFEEGPSVVISVDDTGPGVPSDQVKKLFSPFFTTKGRGRGLGLGLKICRDVVAAHRGHIEVRGATRGASFRVLLPRAKAATRASGTPSPVDAPNATKSIVVIDDDELLARTLRRTLKPHVVRVALTASEGEIVLLDPAVSPDLVLCDVLLPGVNGNELHRRVLAIRPDIANRFVFITGGALGVREAEYLKASGRPTLFKPIALADILAHLGSGGGSAPPSARTLSGSAPPESE